MYTARNMLSTKLISMRHCVRINYLRTLGRRMFSTEQDKDEDSPSFKAIAPEHPPKMKSENVIPGKGPPPEPPVDCCMSGCNNCVWIKYAEELTNYYRDGGEIAIKELDKIENPGLRAFIKLELGYYF